MKNFILCFVIFQYLNYIYPVMAFNDELTEPIVEHKQDLNIYINNFCQGRGRAFVRIQNNVVVDCMTADTLWKIDYADNWSSALTSALFYGIYDNYLGDEQFAPRPGIVLVQEDSDDYKQMLQLRQIVNHYKLSVNLDIIENYAPMPANNSKNMQIEFGKKRFFIIGE